MLSACAALPWPQVCSRLFMYKGNPIQLKKLSMSSVEQVRMRAATYLAALGSLLLLWCTATMYLLDVLEWVPA